MKYILVIWSLVFVSISMLSVPAFAYADANLTVDVSISSYSEITLDPSSLGWYELIPGNTGGVKYVDVENTGSANLTDMYAYVDTNEDETTNPYGTGYIANYAAGAVIVFANQSQGVDAGAGYRNYTFAGRLEWNWTDDVSNTDHSAFNQTPTAWGFFRNVTNDYYWAVRNGTNASFPGTDGAMYCNNSDALFGIEYEADQGTQATRTPEIINISYEGTSDDNNPWGLFAVNNIDSPLYGMCVAVNYTCDKIYIYKYDKRDDFDDCSNSAYVREELMTPNEVQKLSLDVFIPKGLPQGNMTTARFTVAAT